MQVYSGDWNNILEMEAEIMLLVKLGRRERTYEMHVINCKEMKTFQNILFALF